MEGTDAIAVEAPVKIHPTIHLGLGNPLDVQRTGSREINSINAYTQGMAAPGQREDITLRGNRNHIVTINQRITPMQLVPELVPSSSAMRTVENAIGDEVLPLEGSDYNEKRPNIPINRSEESILALGTGIRNHVVGRKSKRPRACRKTQDAWRRCGGFGKSLAGDKRRTSRNTIRMDEPYDPDPGQYKTDQDQPMTPSRKQTQPDSRYRDLR